MSTTINQTRIELRKPSKYLSNPSEPTTNTGEPFVPPRYEWMLGKWTVTDSTRSIWRSAKNVRITYSPHKPAQPTASTPQDTGATKYDSTTEYEKQGDHDGVKTVLAVEEPDPMVPGAWRGRGKGWRAITSLITTSHWQVLGWGERPLASSKGSERWMVAWFQPTASANEGIDIYCDRDEGLSREAANDIINALKEIHAPAMVHAIEKNMIQLTIDLPK
ncbi:hypothetical protein HD806DRAFT_517173 [Xylariaceae sp. AK1471]|nr:hypothetical protein HD806DRAFT_517173 [Xylariaceae sp. AK1471]